MELPNGQRVALVTGAGRGIGLAIAERLSADGYAVALADRDCDAVSSAARSLRGAGANALAVEVDVADSESVNAAVRKVAREFGPVGVLVNNAGVLRDAPLVDMTDDEFRLVLDVCLVGAFYTARACAPRMIESGGGRIVNIASRAYLGNPGQANYSSAKAGLVGLTKSLAKELGRHDITVNAIAPGMVETDMVRDHPKSEAIIARATRANSVPRIGQPSDIAAAVAYLCSDDAGYLTGDVMHISGGRFG